MKEKRRHFIVTVPNDNVIHSLNVCIGLNISQRYSLDGKSLYVKTVQSLIQGEEDKGVSINKIFPPGLTAEYSYSEVMNILKGADWQPQGDFPL